MHSKLKKKKAHWELTKTDQNKELEFIQGQINRFRNLVEDRQWPLAWHIVNEVSGN